MVLDDTSPTYRCTSEADPIRGSKVLYVLQFCPLPLAFPPLPEPGSFSQNAPLTIVLGSYIGTASACKSCFSPTIPFTFSKARDVCMTATISPL